VALHLTDAELRELLQDLAAVIGPRTELPPSPQRVRRMLTTVVMPAERGQAQ
jgi:hypothetical protein